MRKIKLKKIVLIATVLVFAFAVLGIIIWNQNKEAGTTTVIGSADSDITPDIITRNNKNYKRKSNVKAVLLLGIDSEVEMQYIQQEGSKGQADVIALLAWDTARDKVEIVMIPKDTITEIPVTDIEGNVTGKTLEHLGTAFDFEDGNEVSTKFMKESVTNMFGGLRIDEYFEINLSAIEKLNNGVGGVEVIIPYEGMEKSDPSFVKGEKVYLTGELVEKFLRFRDTSEDFSATKRLEIQREYLRAYQEKVKSLNEDSIVEKLLNDIEPYSHTDMSKDMLLKLLTCVMETDNFDGESVTILEGEDKKTELYDEFYPDKEAAMTKIIELFYDME